LPPVKFNSLHHIVFKRVLVPRISAQADGLLVCFKFYVGSSEIYFNSEFLFLFPVAVWEHVGGSFKKGIPRPIVSLLGSDDLTDTF